MKTASTSETHHLAVQCIYYSSHNKNRLLILTVMHHSIPCDVQMKVYTIYTYSLDERLCHNRVKQYLRRNCL
jgi:hypothetical protein